ncbi:MAG: sugar phosphate isomerase/epimerase [Planctomycetes bacterium]|nr:sugar phosphate isomerase/epimerase [Planctomycetota bacterium]MCP4770332.1 sugar phosphate isomerase/epimerase [Planctomycetota bacterium]MCP4861918.1 sugar phosphate isomerase/epimerase [Planctomycetota bacterium]
MKLVLVPLLALSSIAAIFSPAQEPFLREIPKTHYTGDFAVGCQAWTFNRFTAAEAVQMTAAAGGKVIEFFPGQKFSKDYGDLKFDHNLSDKHRNEMRKILGNNGVIAINYGVVGVPNDEAEARKIFEFAKDMGFRSITTESTGSIDVIEKLVKETGVGVGFHNHPRRPKDPNYKVWDPNYILALVKDRDPRIGACADTGHWTRSGIKPVDALKILDGRVISLHMKDLSSFGEVSAHDQVFGTGHSDIPAVLDELKRQGFAGNISIEYEYNWDNSITDVAQCVGFIRGYGVQH